jgi:hypothetical protein
MPNVGGKNAYVSICVCVCVCLSPNEIHFLIVEKPFELLLCKFKPSS